MKKEPIAFVKVKEVAAFENVCDVGDDIPENYKEVYVLLAEDIRKVKIGIAEDAKERFKQIQSMSPCELEMIYLFQTIGFDFENYLHRKFKHLRLDGEWFFWCNEIFEEMERLEKEKVEAGIAFQRLNNAKETPMPEITAAITIE